MTPEELDEARAKEAWRMWEKVKPSLSEDNDVALFAARLAREGWTPPAPVDPDVLAFREWLAGHNCPPSKRILIDRGHYDNDLEATPFLAGARMAREQERERAKVLVEYVWDDAKRPGNEGNRAREVLAKYEGTL